MSAGSGSGLQLVEHDWDRAEIRLLGEEGSAGLNRAETGYAVRLRARDLDCHGSQRLGHLR